MAKARRAATPFFDRKTYKSLGFRSVEDDSTTTKRPRGWRKGVVAAAVLTGLVLFINLLFLLVGVTRFAPRRGIGTIYTGDCGFVKHWDTILHLLINVLATAVLGASNFAIQCLSSPTRSEIDRAHKKKISLDIGLASIKNIFYVDWKKGVLWWALTLSTLPLHLL